jgi:hypothetical protein
MIILHLNKLFTIVLFLKSLDKKLTLALRSMMLSFHNLRLSIPFPLEVVDLIDGVFDSELSIDGFFELSEGLDFALVLVHVIAYRLILLLV